MARRLDRYKSGVDGVISAVDGWWIFRRWSVDFPSMGLWTGYASGSEVAMQGHRDRHRKGYDPALTGNEPALTRYEPPMTGYEPPSTGYDPAGTGNEPKLTGYEPPSTGVGDGDAGI